MIRFKDFMPIHYRNQKYTGLILSILKYFDVIRANILHIDERIRRIEEGASDDTTG